MSENSSSNEEFLSFLDSIHGPYFNGKLFKGSPIAPSREDAMMDIDVNKFINKKYDINIDDKDDGYALSFVERVMERVMESQMQDMHFDINL